MQNLSEFVEIFLYKGLNINRRVQDTFEMITIIDNLNNINKETSTYKFEHFDFTNTFLSINNISEV